MAKTVPIVVACVLTAFGHFGCSAQSAAPASAPGPDSSNARISFYPYQQGWLGGDAAYSVPLSHGRTLWLFGDTFIGKPGATDRSATYGMPRNSVAIATCPAKGNCDLRYFWSHMGSTTPTAFFDTKSSDWYWPLDGFVANGSLYVFLEAMHNQGTGAFGFDYSGVVLASISNFSESPDKWNVAYQTVLSGNVAVPGTALVTQQGSGVNPFPADGNGAKYAYVFTWAKPKSGATFTGLTRIRLGKLAKAALSDGNWEYLSSENRWVRWGGAALPYDARHVMDAGYTEFTVKYHAEAGKLGKWLAVMPSSGFMEKRGVYSLAESIAGPWTPPETLYTYPEMQSTNPSYTKNVFCYADKEHPELEQGNALTFTYVCNSLELPEVMADKALYHPVLITVPFPSH
ncbi:MAG: hypothetical protein ABR923_05365 [Terracidiphilus sp.]|jgi:hypothetical protein